MSTSSLSPTVITSHVSGTTPANPAAPSAVVMIVAPATIAGWDGSIAPVVSNTNRGCGLRPSVARSSAKLLASSGKMCPGGHKRPRGGPQRPRAEHHRSGTSGEEAHKKAVCLIPAADHRSLRCARAKRDHAVERHHEVRIDDLVAEPQAPIDAREPIGHLVPRQLSLVENVERIDQWSARLLTAARNSVRSCGSFS